MSFGGCSDFIFYELKVLLIFYTNETLSGKVIVSTMLSTKLQMCAEHGSGGDIFKISVQVAWFYSS